jgi:hypothetical protein
MKIYFKINLTSDALQSMTTKYRRFLINIVKYICKDAQDMEIEELEKNFSELWKYKFVSADECLKAVRIEFGIKVTVTTPV